MSDRMTAEIAIGGTLRAELVDPLIAAIKAEGVNLWDDSGFDATTAEELVEAAKEEDGRPGTLRLVEYEAIGGQLHELERFLVQNGLAFDRFSDSKYEFDCERTQFRPGMAEPYTRPALKNQEPVVTLDSLEAVKEALECGQPQLGLRLLRETMGPEIPSLEPLQVARTAVKEEERHTANVMGAENDALRDAVDRRTVPQHVVCPNANGGDAHGDVHGDHGQ